MHENAQLSTQFLIRKKREFKHRPFHVNNNRINDFENPKIHVSFFNTKIHD